MHTTPDGITYRVKHFRLDGADALRFIITGRRLKDEPEVAEAVFDIRKKGAPLGRYSNTGGVTVVEIVELPPDRLGAGKDKKELPEPTVLAVGQAVCRPDEAFNKRLVRTIALGRAMKVLKDGS